MPRLRERNRARQRDQRGGGHDRNALDEAGIHIRPFLEWTL
jgi:hypothetical protein